MAIRTNTVEFPFDQNVVAVAAGVRYDFPAITLYIPETDTRTFLSVILHVAARQDDAAATNITSRLLGIKLGAVAFDDVSSVELITNSGEHISRSFERDVTAYFTPANFGAGTSQTCQVGVQFGAASFNNISAKLIITYSYDDAAAATRVKTVRIPLESPVGSQPNGAPTEFGTNQVPALDTFCPESGKVFRDIWFEVAANEATSGTTDFQLGLSLDADPEALDGLHESALNSSCWYERIWRQTAMATNAVHAFKARSTQATAAFTMLTVTLHVTYEYDHAASTVILNSLFLPIVAEADRWGGPTEAERSRSVCDVWIEEPGPITMAQSGVQFTFIEKDSLTGINVSVGAQGFRAYTHVAGVATCGGYGFQQRIDAGSDQGAALALARGRNTFVVDWYRTDLFFYGSAMAGRLILNYTSGKHADGTGAHNHTTVFSVLAMQSAAQITSSASLAPTIPETDYWLNGLGFDLDLSTDTTNAGYSWRAEILGGEDVGDGWRHLQSHQYNADGEISWSRGCAPGCDDFLRFPGDVDATRLDPTAARVYQMACTVTASWSTVKMYVTHHSITFTVAGNLYGYSGDGSGVTVKLHRAGDGEELAHAVSAIGGGYSFTWYDDTENVYTEAWQDASHVGRGDVEVAS